MESSDVLDISKENIQPLRQGRKAAQLKTALQAQTDPETHQKLLKQREKFEYMIRMYEGDDPLEPYYKYVIWLEQSFPTTGRENNLILLLEDTLLKFKDCDKYKQDPRLIQLLIKYINVQPNALELYQLVYNQGLGTMCSMFYKAWAEELDRSNDFKRADQVYQLGLQCRASPVNELQEAHVQFQLSIARRILEGNMNEPPPTNEPSRTVLSKLQPSKVKSSRVSKDSAGKLPTGNGHSGLLKSSNVGTAKFTVYQEDEVDGYAKSEYKNESEKLPKGSIAGRENIMKASKWSGQKHKQPSAYRMSCAPSTPFTIHEDPDAVCDTAKTVLRPCALKVRKEEFRCPVAVFGSPDPTKKPMYPKQLVYVGGRDMQLEEIRAAYYWKKVEEEENTTTSMDIVRCVEPSATISQSRKTLSSLDVHVDGEDTAGQENEFVKPKHLPSVSEIRVFRDEHTFDKPSATSSTKQTFEFDCDGKRNVFAEMGLSNEAKKLNDIENSTIDTHPLIDPFADMDTKPCRAKADTSSFAISEQGNMSLFHHSPSTSMTVNTRAAMNVIQQMWESPLSQQSVKRTNKDISTKSDHHPFSVYCDSRLSMRGTADRAEEVATLQEKNVDALKHARSAKDLADKMRGFTDDLGKMGDVKRTNKDISTKSDHRPFSVYCKDSISKTDEKCTNDIGDLLGVKRTNKHISTKSDHRPFSVYCEDSILKTDEKCTNDTEDLPDTQKTKTDGKSGQYPFPIYCEDTGTVVKEIQKPQNIDDLLEPPTFAKPRLVSRTATEDDNPVSSMLKMSDECGIQFGTPSSAAPLIVPVNLQDTPVEPHNKENRYPIRYLTSDECKISSAAPREINDDSFLDIAGHLEYPKNIMDDETTCNTNAFRIVLPSSTPRSFSQSSKKSTYG